MTMAKQIDDKPILEFARRLVAVLLVLTGLYMAIFGNAWGPLVFSLLPDSAIGAWLELIVPFLPMLVIGLGAALFGRRRRAPKA